MKKILSLALLGVILLSATACDKSENSIIDSVEETQFDVDRVCESIVIKGHKIEIPIRLCDIGGEWSYELMSESVETGLNGAYVYCEGELIYSGSVNNCYKGNEGDGIIYYVAIEDDSGSIDGITPLKATKQEVIEKYGEPSFKQGDEAYEAYYYGSKDLTPLNALGGRYVFIAFENGIVTCVSVSCSDHTVDLNNFLE